MTGIATLFTKLCWYILQRVKKTTSTVTRVNDRRREDKLKILIRIYLKRLKTGWTHWTGILIKTRTKLWIAKWETMILDRNQINVHRNFCNILAVIANPCRLSLTKNYHSLSAIESFDEPKQFAPPGLFKDYHLSFCATASFYNRPYVFATSFSRLELILH